MLLLSARKTPRTPPARSARNPFRLRLEPLEDRCLLSGGGALDPAFGSGGMVSVSGVDSAPAVVVQPDGKIVTDTYVAGGGSTKAGAVLKRFNPDGSVDTSFGTNGTTVPQSGTINGLAIGANSKIVAVSNYNNQEMKVARYNADGSLDSTFGSGGIVLTDVNPFVNRKNSGFETPSGVAIQGDGKIVVGGFIRVVNNLDAQYTLIRYNADGTLDTSFGNQSPRNGITITPQFGGGGGLAYALALQSDGNILLAGDAGRGSGLTSMAVARYLGAGTAAGQLDSSFGTGGTVTIAPSGSAFSSALGVLVQSSQNNAIVVSGYSNFGSQTELNLARLTNGGQLDTTFGGSGTGFALNSSMTTQGFVGGLVIALHPNGDLLTAGTAVPTSNLAVAAYLPGGTPDTTFGTGGITTANFPGGSQGISIAIQPSDGKIVAAGTTGSGSALALARFLAPGTNSPLTAAASASHPIQQTLTAEDVEPLVAQAVSRWQAAGIDSSALRAIDIRVADLGSRTLGLAAGKTILLDENAAGRGWLGEMTPRDDSGFIAPGNQGEQKRMDLPTVVMREGGHLRGHDYGVMQGPFAAGVREPDCGQAEAEAGISLTDAALATSFCSASPC
jgi:uncharacterized delta-60 repeat protein